MSIMITENQIIDAVADYLETEGWTIKQKLTTSQPGFDIIANKNGLLYYIEAKGGTSSKNTSARFGLPFNSAQAKSHIGQALWKTGEALTQNPSAKYGIALPDEPCHRTSIEKIASMIKLCGITIFWVGVDLKTRCL